ncbi:chitinase [bacterium RCC_150]
MVHEQVLNVRAGINDGGRGVSRKQEYDAVVEAVAGSARRGRAKSSSRAQTSSRAQSSGDGQSKRPERPIKRLSAVARVCVAAGLVVAGVGGLLLWRASTEGSGGVQAPWFSGYIDVTVVPQYSFESAATPSTKNAMLAFVVASSEQPCTASWGSTYSLDQAKTSLELESHIADLRSKGGSVAISFGGSVNSELANSCQNQAYLQDAYQAVLDRYAPATIDFDIEGDNLADASAWQRRATAVAALQRTRSEKGQPLYVWLTLPVTPNGLTDAGTSAVDKMLAAGVQLAGVNIMTMNYGSSRNPSQSMLDAAISAAQSTHEQLSIIYQRAGMNLSGEEVWKRMGVTPMIGRNDLPGEVFDLDAARGLNTFAVSKGISRVSMWSLNRDMPCRQEPAHDSASHICSGIAQGSQKFSEVLGAGLPGKLP